MVAAAELPVQSITFDNPVCSDPSPLQGANQEGATGGFNAIEDPRDERTRFQLYIDNYLYSP
jgi:hypothetical protein